MKISVIPGSTVTFELKNAIVSCTPTAYGQTLVKDDGVNESLAWGSHEVVEPTTFVAFNTGGEIMYIEVIPNG